MRLLLDAGAPLEAKASPSGFTPLILAASQGQTECCELLLAAGAKHGALTPTRYTALHWAALSGHVPVIKTLVAAGAAVNLQNKDKRTALHLAAAAGQIGAVSCLLSRGADVNAVDKLGNTPIRDAVLFGHLMVVRVLLPGSDLSLLAVGGDGLSILHSACGGGNQEIFDMLLPLVPDIDVRSLPDADAARQEKRAVHSSTPLHLAAQLGRHAMVTALLAKGALRTARDSRQQTPLHLAAMYGKAPCVRALCEGGYDFAAAEQEDAMLAGGWAALHCAAYNGDLECCKALLEAGANARGLTAQEETPRALTQQEFPERKELIELLLAEELKAGAK
jgi:uncharacterized protein